MIMILNSGLDPITQGLDAATQGYVPYYGYGHHAYGHYYGKRLVNLIICKIDHYNSIFHLKVR